MVKNAQALRRFHLKWLAKERCSYAEALRIFEALRGEAVSLGALRPEDILEGIETNIKIAKAVHELES